MVNIKIRKNLQFFSKMSFAELSIFISLCSLLFCGFLLLSNYSELKLEGFEGLDPGFGDFGEAAGLFLKMGAFSAFWGE